MLGVKPACSETAITPFLLPYAVCRACHSQLYLKASSMPKSCVFCGERPTSNEHLFPHWMSTLLTEDPRGFPAIGLHTREVASPVYGVQRQTWRKDKVIDYTANCVCRSCNHGWMERIEADARPYLTPMIKGERMDMSTERWGAIARWRSLKAIIERYTSPPAYIHGRWQKRLYRHGEIPDTWTIRVGAYNGSRPAFASSFVFKAHPRKADGQPNLAISRPRALVTLLAGSFVGQVLVSEKVIPGYVDPEGYFIRLWPSPTKGAPRESANWPPPLVINDDILDLIIDARLPVMPPAEWRPKVTG